MFKIMCMESTICQAIEEHHLLWLRYRGERRIVEPHIYGEDSHGRELLSAYQIAGGSRSGQPVGWKLFDMEKIEDVEVLSRRFPEPEPAYNAGDKTFSKVYAC